MKRAAKYKMTEITAEFKSGTVKKGVFEPSLLTVAEALLPCYSYAQNQYELLAYNLAESNKDKVIFYQWRTLEEPYYKVLIFDPKSLKEKYKLIKNFEKCRFSEGVYMPLREVINQVEKLENPLCFIKGLGEVKLVQLKRMLYNQKHNKKVG